MSDYVQELRNQLVEAAAREQARRRPRLPLTLPPLRPLVAGLAVAAVIAGALVVVLGRSSTGTHAPPVATTPDNGRPLFDGTLEAKVRYSTRNLVPPVSITPDDGFWTAVATDASDTLFLQRDQPRAKLHGGVTAGLPPAGYLAVGRVPRFYDPRSKAKRLVRPTDPIAFIRHHPDVSAGAPFRARVAGRDATAIDLTYTFTRPSHAAPSCRYRDFRCTLVGPGDVHLAGEHERVYVLDFGGTPLVIGIGGFPGTPWKATLGHALRTLGTLELGG